MFVAIDSLNHARFHLSSSNHSSSLGHCMPSLLPVQYWERSTMSWLWIWWFHDVISLFCLAFVIDLAFWCRTLHKKWKMESCTLGAIETASVSFIPFEFYEFIYFYQEEYREFHVFFLVIVWTLWAIGTEFYLTEIILNDCKKTMEV